MKFAILLALAAVAAASTFEYTPPVHSTVFKPGEQYVYHYKGQVLNGVPKLNSQYSGLLIDSIVVLQFHQDYKVVMKMEKIKLFKIHNKITTLPTELLPETELTHLTGEQSTIITEYLNKPIKFRYEEGDIREIEKENHDRFWSVNIKKGVLSLFLVTLKEKSSYPSDSSSYVDPTMSRIKSYSSRNSYSSSIPSWKLNTKTNSVYKVMETDVIGNCETKYTLISDKTHLSPSTSKMHVTAVRNFDNCVSKPFYIQGLFQGVYRYPAENDLVQPVVHYDYVITGDRSHFLIKEATLHGKYIFLTNGLEGGDISSYVFQHLTLKSTEPIRSPFRLTSPKLEMQGLQMIIPQATLLPEKKSYDEMMGSKSRSGEEYLGYRQKLQREFGGMSKSYESDLFEEEDEKYVEDSKDITSVVEMKLSELIQCLYPMSDKKCSSHVLEISRVMRALNKPQLKSLITRYLRGGEEWSVRGEKWNLREEESRGEEWNTRGEQLSSSETDYRKAEILLDILPTLPSPSATKVLIELIRERKISDIRGKLMVKTMSLLVKPTPTVIKSVVELFKELPKERTSHIAPKTLLRQALLLSVGTLTHRLINVMRTLSKPVPEIITFIDSISSELKSMLEQSQSESEKVLILKSLGNMGASETIRPIKVIIEDQSQPIRVRVNGVFALRRLAKQFRKEVVPILLSVFMDVKEVREVRQAAFVVIINANPSYPTLQMIAHSLRHEPHSQIRTLVYSSLINLAEYKSHEPEHKTLKQNARLILKYIPPVHVGVQDSMSVFLNMFSEDLDLGGALNVIKIKSKMSGLPEVLSANIQGRLFGKHRRLLEVGATGRSLEVILKKIFGPNGLLKEILKGQVSLRDVLKPFGKPDLGGVELKIREILTKMMYELRTEEEPFGSWYIHLLGNELQYIVINSQTIEEVINKVTNYLPELLMKLTRGVKVDVIKTLSSIQSLTIATPIGIPLTLNHTTMGIFKVNGHVKVHNLPSWPEMVSRFSSFSTAPKLGLEVDLKPYVDVTHSLTLGADLRWLAFGAGGDLNIRAMKPVKFSSSIDVPKQSISVKYYTLNETVKVLHVNAHPNTFVKRFPTTIEKLPFTMDIKEIKSEHIVKVTPFQYEHVESVTGMRAEVRGTYSMCGPTWCPTFLGKQEINIIAHPVTSNDFVHLKIRSLRSNFDFEGIPSSTVAEQLFEKYPEEMEEEQNSYGDRNYRTSSRSMIESGEFEPIPVDPIFSSEPIKRQILVTLESNTHQSPKVKSLITWLMGRKYLKNQLNVQVIRLSHGQTPSWKIHLNNVINPETWYPEETYKGETEFLSKMHLIWTREGERTELKVKVVPGSPFDFSRELSEHRILNTLSLPETKSQKIKYTVEVDFPHMTHRVQKYMTIVHDFVKFQVYDKLTTSIPNTPLNNKVIVAVELLPWWEQMNVIVKTPRENSYISSVPFYWNPFLPTSEKIRLHDLPAWKWYKSTTDEEYFRDTVPYKTTPIKSVMTSECTVDPEKVNTFDDVIIPISSVSDMWGKHGCSMVMAQHCTNEGLFSVVGTGSTDSWKMKILVPKYDLEVVYKYNHLKLLVNGDEKRVEPSQPLIIPEESYETSRKLYTIEKPESGVLKIKGHELGVSITIEGQKVEIKVSPFSMLQGELCGLCGNFNQDQSDDFFTTSDFKPENRDFTRMTKRSLFGPESCNIDTIKKVSSDYCMKESHVTVRRYDNDVPLTCRSEHKLPSCAEGCRPEQTVSTKVCFTCLSEEGVNLPRKTYLAPRWDTYESGVECEDFFQRVEVPTRCVPTF